MLKKLIDTNIFIDRFGNPDLYKEIFLSDGFIYLSSVVLMELRAGAHTREAVIAVADLGDFFKKVGRIVIPNLKDYERTGEILSELQRIKGYDIKKSSSITNDCLIAVSARSIGATVYTQNKRDFQAIRDALDFKVDFV